MIKAQLIVISPGEGFTGEAKDDFGEWRGD